ncbi:MAG: radical SAM protein, partial [Pseudomonadota bacterium]
MTALEAIAQRTDGPPGPDDDAGFAVYVHWPFCAAKCPYCDFNSHVRHGGVDQVRFANALATEIAAAAKETPGRTLRSIFFGGGTPSLMAPETVETVLHAISDGWGLPENLEITMEANPTSVEAGRFRAYRALGVNRVSLGVQALNDRDLKQLGRLHSAEEAVAAVELAQRVFPRVSYDLIYARSGQTVAMWERELRDALTLADGHLSLYQLTIEPGTPFHALHAKGALVVPDEDVAHDLFMATQAICGETGL